MKCSEILHILDDNLIEILQKENKALITALDKMSDYNLRLERQLSDERMENLRLETDRDALAAQVYRMSEFIRLSAKKWEGVPEVEPTFWNLLRVANEAPQQCLAEIKAEAYEAGFMKAKFVYNCELGYCSTDIHEWFDEWESAKLRQGGAV